MVRVTASGATTRISRSTFGRRAGFQYAVFFSSSALARGTSLPGPAVASSWIVSIVPAPSGRSSSRTVASPAGHPCALSTSSESGVALTTVVSSLNTAGQIPNEWCTLVPSAGQPASTLRIRLAPTTHVAYSQPSARTVQTSAGDAATECDTGATCSPWNGSSTVVTSFATTVRPRPWRPPARSPPG